MPDRVPSEARETPEGRVPVSVKVDRGVPVGGHRVGARPFSAKVAEAAEVNTGPDEAVTVRVKAWVAVLVWGSVAVMVIG